MRVFKPVSLVTLVVVLTLLPAAGALAQKRGGVLRWMVRGSPADLSIHETAVTAVSSVGMPMYNNLVWFDSLRPFESEDTIIPDLAESWSWGEGGKSLTFKLHRGVTWHDGKPFTGADVKHTFDVLRGVKSSGLKLNPRKLWYFNIESIVTNGDHEVTFKLVRPQPSLLSMLATGYTPIYAAHVNAGQMRTTALGTGPFKLKRYERDQIIEMERNPAYFKHTKPYLDGVHYVIFKSASAEQAALVAKQIDALALIATPAPVYQTLKAANVGLAFEDRVTNGTINVIYNSKVPPFNDPRMVRAVSLSLDRDGIIKSVFQNGAMAGSALIPAPHGNWGMTPEQLAQMPGYGDPARNKAEARRLLAELGYSESNPFKLKITVRNVISSTQSATWAAGELKQVGVLAELAVVDPGVYYGLVARREFLLAIQETAIGIDDPDATFYETYACGSERNYTDYCNPELNSKVDAQSQEFDSAKRHALVHEIDAQLTVDNARPYLVYRKDFYAHYPYVKNWIPHISLYNGWRLEDVWLDR